MSSDSDFFLSGGFIKSPGARPVFVLDGEITTEYWIPFDQPVFQILVNLAAEGEWFMFRPPCLESDLCTLYVTRDGVGYTEELVLEYFGIVATRGVLPADSCDEANDN